jgi:hypothetical protein
MLPDEDPTLEGETGNIVLDHLWDSLEGDHFIIEVLEKLVVNKRDFLKHVGWLSEILLLILL